MEKHWLNLNGDEWSLANSAYGHMVSSMMVAEHVGVRMIKKYFDTSKKIL